MVILTGAGGFIGSVVLGYLNRAGIDAILIDDLPHWEQYKNLANKKFLELHKADLESHTRLLYPPGKVKAVIHLGAITHTSCTSWTDLYKANIESTRFWNNWCIKGNIPFIFASSAAVYGNGEGPLNKYGFSKYVSEQEVRGVILRLFNVYGPNEYHKAVMASVLCGWGLSATRSGPESPADIWLFKDSDKYVRDFIYVEDVARVIMHFLDNYTPGTYDVGTGDPRSFDELADVFIKELGGKKQTKAMPYELSKQYQTHTKADVSALAATGFDVSTLRKIEEGVPEYCKYLKNTTYF